MRKRNGGARVLAIKHLSASGEIIEAIECRCGQITVLRSFAPSALRPYQRALSGASGPEIFSISVDNQPYAPHQHLLIGFGERGEEGGQRVNQYLTGFGVPEQMLHSILLSCGLESQSESPLAELNPSQARMVQLIAATNSQHPIMILHDPFEPLATQWRERFAEALLAQVVAQKQIIVVTHLSARPECWIGSEVIQRVQVGESAQRTIGFTNASSALQSALKDIRSMSAAVVSHAIESPAVSDQNASAPLSSKEVPPQPAPVLSPAAHSLEGGASKEPAQESASLLAVVPTAGRPILDGSFGKMPPLKRGLSLQANPTRALVVMLFAVGAVVGSAYLTNAYDRHREAERVALVVQQEREAAAQRAAEIAAQNPPTPVLTPAPESGASARAPVQHVLDTYSPKIRDSILLAYKNNESDEASNGEAHEEQPRVEHSNTNSDLLRLLQSASEKEGGGAAGNSGRSNQVENSFSEPDTETAEVEDMDWEQRRELMRQRFLESIAQAQ